MSEPVPRRRPGVSSVQSGGSAETGRASRGSHDALTPVLLPVPRVHSPAGVARPRAGRLFVRDAGGKRAHGPERAG